MRGQFITTSIDLQGVVQQMCEGGDSDTPIEFLNLLAAHVLETHGRQHTDKTVKTVGGYKRKRFEIFIDRCGEELSEDAVLLLRMMTEAKNDKG